MKFRKLLFLIFFYSCFLIISYPLSLSAQGKGNIEQVLGNLDFAKLYESGSYTINITDASKALYVAKLFGSKEVGFIDKNKRSAGTLLVPTTEGFKKENNFEQTKFDVIDDTPITNYTLEYKRVNTNNQKKNTPIRYEEIEVIARNADKTPIFTANLKYRCTNNDCTSANPPTAAINYSSGIVQSQLFILDKNTNKLKEDQAARKLFQNPTTNSSAILKSRYDSLIKNENTPLFDRASPPSIPGYYGNKNDYVKPTNDILSESIQRMAGSPIDVKPLTLPNPKPIGTSPIRSSDESTKIFQND